MRMTLLCQTIKFFLTLLREGFLARKKRLAACSGAPWLKGWKCKAEVSILAH